MYNMLQLSLLFGSILLILLTTSSSTLIDVNATTTSATTTSSLLFENHDINYSNNHNQQEVHQEPQDHDSTNNNNMNIICNNNEWMNHPHLCSMLYRAEYDLINLANEMYKWSKQYGFIIDLDIQEDKMNKDISSITLREESKVIPQHKTTSKTKIRRRARGTKQQQNRHLSLVEEESVLAEHISGLQEDQQLPVVIAHGMGDSCYNHGIQSIVEYISSLLGNVNVTCIPIGKTFEDDTKNGYLYNMNDSIDLFATQINIIHQSTDLYKNGFHAIGFSQGNNIIRGYIAKYNHIHTVNTFISVNGVNAGIGAVPFCIPSNTHQQKEQQEQNSLLSSSVDNRTNNNNYNYNIILQSFDMCEFLMEQASKHAYTEFVQKHSFQANYWRDPRKSIYPLYQKYSQLAILNNEVVDNNINETYRINWNLTSKFIWILASDDTMVWPKDGEQWGQPNVDDPYHQPIISRYNSSWYINDLFGLRTAEESHKNYYESFHGDHLQFTNDDLTYWITTYFKTSSL